MKQPRQMKPGPLEKAIAGSASAPLASGAASAPLSAFAPSDGPSDPSSPAGRRFSAGGAPPPEASPTATGSASPVSLRSTPTFMERWNMVRHLENLQNIC